MPPTLSLLALDPHLALLRPPGLLIRRDTARIADAHPALPCACSVSAGYGSREATRICPSPAEGETDRAAEEGWEPLGWTEDGRTWGELDADDLLHAPRQDRAAWALDIVDGPDETGAVLLRGHESRTTLCPGCGRPEVVGQYTEPVACPPCGRRLEADTLAAEDAAQPEAANGGGWDDDPDPGDGGLGLSWAAEVEAESRAARTCPDCGAYNPHLPPGASCLGCLLGRAA